MYQRPASPRPIGGVLGGAFHLLAATFTQVVGLAILYCAIAGAGGLFDDTLDNLAAGTFDPEEETSIQELLPAWLGGLVGLYFFLGVVARMSAFASNRPVSIAEALRRALRRFPALLVCLLVLFAPFLLAGVLTAVLAVSLAFAGLAAPSVAGMVGLMALTSAPALVMGVYLHLAAFLVVTADVGSVTALRRSFRLVRRNFWRTTALQAIGTAAAMLVGAGGLAMGAFLAGFFDNVSINVAAYPIQIAVGAVTAPFFAALSLALLRDLELRHEGEGLVVWR